VKSKWQTQAHVLDHSGATRPCFFDIISFSEECGVDHCCVERVTIHVSMINESPGSRNSFVPRAANHLDFLKSCEVLIVVCLGTGLRTSRKVGWPDMGGDCHSYHLLSQVLKDLCMTGKPQTCIVVH